MLGGVWIFRSVPVLCWYTIRSRVIYDGKRTGGVPSIFRCALIEAFSDGLICVLDVHFARESFP